MHHVNACCRISRRLMIFPPTWLHVFSCSTTFSPRACLLSIASATTFPSFLLSHVTAIICTLLSPFFSGPRTATVDQSSHDNGRQSKTNRNSTSAAAKKATAVGGTGGDGMRWTRLDSQRRPARPPTTETRNRATQLPRSPTVRRLFFGKSEK